MNSKAKIRSGIPDLIIPGTENQDDRPVLTSFMEERVDVLNRYFASVFTKEDNNACTIEDWELLYPLDDLTITPDQVQKRLKDLNPSKSPDNIHPRLLKEMSVVLSEPLSILFNTSLKEGTLQSEWKCGNMSAIHKKGSNKDPGNYRPVSLTSIACKVLEALVQEHIMKHMTQNELFSTQQFRFLPGHSTTLQLLRVLDD